MKSSSFVPFIFMFMPIIFCIYMAFNVKPISGITKTEWGRASKITFEDHSYVIWQNNLTDCILHDPDCKCNQKRENENIK